MDSQSTLPSSTISSATTPMPSIEASSTLGVSDDSGFFDSLSSISLSTWLIVILILAFLGFNIFVYLAKGTQDFTSFFGPFVEKIFGTAAMLTGQTVDVAAEGAKAVVGGSADVINSGLSSVQGITPNGSSSSLKTQSVQGTIPQPDVTANNTLNRALNSSQQQQQQQQSKNDYEAHDAPSSIGKAGWCFVGEDRGFRSCSQVGVNDDCMSGDIFPSQELCINPSLRT
jgi:hypothetical protein